MAVEFPELVADWEDRSNHIVLLAARNEFELLSFYDDQVAFKVPNMLFREPDIDDEATALALLPRLDSVPEGLRKFSLALRSDNDPRSIRERELRRCPPSSMERG